jgi:hypothetical protein
MMIPINELSPWLLPTTLIYLVLWILAVVIFWKSIRTLSYVEQAGTFSGLIALLVAPAVGSVGHGLFIIPVPGPVFIFSLFFTTGHLHVSEIIFLVFLAVFSVLVCWAAFFLILISIYWIYSLVMRWMTKEQIVIRR